jgi:hypothetical protein
MERSPCLCVLYARGLLLGRLYYSEQRYAYGHCAISSVFSSTGVVLLLFTIEDHSWHYRISLH